MIPGLSEQNVEDINNPRDFRLTEGRMQRNDMADCESDCSCVLSFLYVGGHKVSIMCTLILPGISCFFFDTCALNP